MPSKHLKLAVAQSRTLNSTAETLRALESTTIKAARQGARFILFPEAYLGGYPRTCNFGATIGGREPHGREQFLKHFQDAIDLGDTPAGAGDDWTDRKLPLAKGCEYRGDGTREELERIAKETDVFIATGVIERAGGSLYCAVLYVDPKNGVLGKRRKVMPTGTERLVWGMGSPSTLRAVTTVIDGVKLTLAAAICWENFMPMLRQSLYCQNVNLYLAPTADSRPTWRPLMITAAFEGRAFVLSCNQCQKRSHLPEWITHHQQQQQPEQTPSIKLTQGAQHSRRSSTISKTHDDHEICWPIAESVTDDHQEQPRTHGERRSSVITKTAEDHEICWSTNGSAIEDEPKSNAKSVRNGSYSQVHESTLAHKESKRTMVSDQEEFLSRGGSCIVSPMGEVLAGPLWDTDHDGEILVVNADFEDCERGRLDIDVAGHYSRSDVFKLNVEGLDLSPPP